MMNFNCILRIKAKKATEEHEKTNKQTNKKQLAALRLRNNRKSIEDVIPNICSRKEIIKEINLVRKFKKLVFINRCKDKDKSLYIYSFQNHRTIAYSKQELTQETCLNLLLEENKL